ncbi:HutD family protein [Streptomyces sp. KL118A]|uniref:HutD/Ves family protein n=1 Tax=Streptomyces sp. KL118A TaxID=3045153 RepID=UPI00278C0C21|nr:HutD family protein [Streptomyces sp. KL118A]
MDADVLRWSAYRSVPWKNGGGITREVADGADWRVSVADVAGDGAFSVFPGLDRVITPVEGGGMVLTVDGTPWPVGPLTPFAFPGDAATDCRVTAGAVRNLNVMTRRGRATAQVEIVTVTAAQETGTACAAGETLLVMAVTEGIAVGGAAGRETSLGRLDCVRRDGPGTLAVGGEGAVARIRITATR